LFKIRETRNILKKWLWADYMLYDFFVVKFEQAKEKFGVDRMASRLRDFFDLNRAVREDCVMMQADNRQGWINLMAD
jgi:hypothetical protein